MLHKLNILVNLECLMTLWAAEEPVLILNPVQSLLELFAQISPFLESQEQYGGINVAFFAAPITNAKWDPSIEQAHLYVPDQTIGATEVIAIENGIGDHDIFASLAQSLIQMQREGYSIYLCHLSCWGFFEDSLQCVRFFLLFDREILDYFEIFEFLLRCLFQIRIVRKGIVLGLLFLFELVSYYFKEFLLLRAILLFLCLCLLFLLSMIPFNIEFDSLCFALLHQL